MKITALITAGGLGVRMGAPLPKPWLELKGKTILEHTIDIFLQNPNIQSIVLTVPQGHQSPVEAPNLTVVKGGETRQESVFEGLKEASKNKPDLVVIHDGVRCLLTQDSLNECIQACHAPWDGVVCAVPVSNTLKKVQDNEIKETIDRDGLWAMQTPQVFFFDAIFKAYQEAKEKQNQATDDAHVMQSAGGHVRVIRGQTTNLKITYPEDIVLAKAIMESR